jgi:hypothetical protein
VFGDVGADESGCAGNENVGNFSHKKLFASEPTRPIDHLHGLIYLMVVAVIIHGLYCKVPFLPGDFFNFSRSGL